jgi:hypothetical protein
MPAAAARRRPAAAAFPRGRRSAHAGAWSRGRARRGAALAEAVVAGVLLAVGVLAGVAVVARAAGDVGRARAADAGAELLAERVAAWRASPCVASAGERVVGAVHERWRVVVAGGLAVLADTVTPASGGPGPRAGVVAAAGCGP